MRVFSDKIGTWLGQQVDSFISHLKSYGFLSCYGYLNYVITCRRLGRVG
jgi:hypothetical protein